MRRELFQKTSHSNSISIFSFDSIQRRHMTQDLKLDPDIELNLTQSAGFGPTSAGGFLKFDISETIGSYELPLHTHSTRMLKRSFMGLKSEQIFQRGAQPTSNTNYDLDLRSANFREPKIMSVYVPNRVIIAPSVACSVSSATSCRNAGPYSA